MIDKRQREIKDRISRYAMDLWGISDPSRMDPIVDLLLDVFAYNSSRLYQDIDAADASILHRLARLLVPHKWSLPFPSHALMTVCPASDNIRTLSIKDHFYADRMIFGKGAVRLFFTPLANYPLIQAQVKCIAFGHKILTYMNDGRYVESFSDRDGKDDENSVWVGIEISEQTLLNTESLTLCILPEDNRLTPFIKDIQAYDTDGNPLCVHNPSFSLPDKEKYHYFDDISDYYADHFITIDLTEQSCQEKLCCTSFPRIWNNDTVEKNAGNLYWVKLQFPKLLSYMNFEGMRILMNTFPVVNRRAEFKRHSFAREGTIISLPCDDGMHLLNVDSLQDNTGKDYTDMQSHYEERHSGAFSLYFGNLERFDSDNASTLIIRLMQLIREDGSAFFSTNTDLLDAQLNELYTKIDEIGKNVYDTIQRGSKQRAFLLTLPQKNAEDAEVRYWVTDGDTANGLDSRSLLYQHGIDKFLVTGIRFQTVTKQGTVHRDEQDLINSLRYGLLSRDRIVTQEDVRSYIFHKMGALVKSVDIRDGIDISPDVRKGIVRTTEVRITVRQMSDNETVDLPATAHFLEKELTKRSISKIPYKIFFE